MPQNRPPAYPIGQCHHNLGPLAIATNIAMQSVAIATPHCDFATGTPHAQALQHSHHPSNTLQMEHQTFPSQLLAHSESLSQVTVNSDHPSIRSLNKVSGILVNYL